jgi:hypothetical protein
MRADISSCTPWTASCALRVAPQLLSWLWAVCWRRLPAALHDSAAAAAERSAVSTSQHLPICSRVAQPSARLGVGCHQEGCIGRRPGCMHPAMSVDCTHTPSRECLVLGWAKGNRIARGCAHCSLFFYCRRCGCLKMCGEVACCLCLHWARFGHSVEIVCV